MRRFLIPLLPCLLCAETPQPARIQVFQATATAVRKGEPVTLRWSVAGADKVRLEPLGLVLPPQGEMTQPVTARSVYWLHAANLWGGQSLPLVVDVLPEAPAAPGVDPAPIPAPAAGPQPSAPMLQVPPPAVAALPTAPAPLQAPPAAVAALPRHHRLRPAAPRRAWIQFAAGTSLRGIRKLQRRLQAAAAVQATLTARPRRAGAPMHLVRTGPFPSAQAARQRLLDLAPVMQAMNLKPIVVTGPDPAQTATVRYLASAPKAGG